MPQVIGLLIPYGLVTSGQLICNVKNGFSLGEALVEMELIAGKTAIHALNNLRFMNYFIKVEESL